MQKNNANGNDWLTGTNGALFVTDPNQTVNNSKMTGLWGLMNGSVIAWMFFMFVITGYRVMGGAFGFKYAESLETLPRVVLAMAGSAISLFFMTFIINVENGLIQFVLTSVKGNVLAGRDFTEVVVPVNDWLGNMGLFLAALFGGILAAILTAIPGIGWLIGGAVGALAGGAFLALLQKFILTLLSVILAVQLIMRIAMINVHIALGPWAFGLGSHWPELFQKWLKNFLALVFVQLMQVLCIAVSFAIFAKPNNDVGAIFSDPAGFIAPIAILWLTLRIPKMFGASAIGIMSEAGQAAGGAVMTGATAASSMV
ncbi:MAG: hypothetical protein JOZ18_11085 [Chloroflexi bacterium]|nr:hypothetical protein [Chloroflexota bacterium]